jgi:hypothetical protein
MKGQMKDWLGSVMSVVARRATLQNGRVRFKTPFSVFLYRAFFLHPRAEHFPRHDERPISVVSHVIRVLQITIIGNVANASRDGDDRVIDGGRKWRGIGAEWIAKRFLLIIFV